MWSDPAGEVECPACGLTVPWDLTADIQTGIRRVTVCQSCHGHLTPGAVRPRER